MRLRPLTLSLLMLVPRAVRAQAPIEILGRSGGVRVPDDAGVEAPSGPRECPSESWTFEVNLPATTTAPPTVWASASFSCSLGERGMPGATCFELCGASRNVCNGALTAGGSRYRFSVPTRWLVDPAGGQCLSASGRRAVFLLVGDEVVALSPRRVRFDLLPPAPPRAADITSFEDRVEARWSYGASGTSVTDAGTTTVDAGDAGGSDAGGSDAGAVSAANGGEEAVARFHVLCDPPPGMEPAAMDGGACGTGALSTLDLSRDELLARHRCAPEQAATARSTTLTGLRLGARYEVAVVAEDLAGNRSRVSIAPRCGSPSPVTDFWENYRGAGGAAEPGLCSARPWRRGARGSQTVLLALGLAAARRRHRQRRGSTSGR